MPPAENYRQRLAAREALFARLEARHLRLGNVRLALAAVTLAIGWTALTTSLSGFWALLPVATFIGVVIHHYTVRQTRNRAERAVAFYETRIACIEDRWQGKGSGGERFDEPHHVYAADLDLFGNSGLFQLLSTARTRMGEDTLADWLLNPASPETVRERQACLRDLRDRVDLREAIAVLGEHSKVGVRPEALLRWAEAPNQLTARGTLAVAITLPALALAGIVTWSVFGIATPLLFVLVAEALTLRVFKKRIQHALKDTEAAFEDLGLFADVLLRLEAEPVVAEPLKGLIRRLSSHTLPASQTIAKLRTRVGFMEARRNPIMSVAEVPLMYSLHTTLAAERWRAEHGAVVRAWVSAVGEFEALLSLAAYHYEHPADPFPELVDGPARFEGTALGHPLLPGDRCVRNDVSIGDESRVMLISGSNMSGKSTLLRTVGVNVVLAMAGAPVRAGHLRLTPLQVGASIRINDSLHEGSSRFYAEITRLRQLLELTRDPLPLLYLLDEMLQGTNSKDRLIGAEGVVTALVERGAIGLISTHDLALTDIGGLPAGALHNVHFQDEIENGRMKFDFTLREGVVTRSNGVELMRSVGLDV